MMAHRLSNFSTVSIDSSVNERSFRFYTLQVDNVNHLFVEDRYAAARPGFKRQLVILSIAKDDKLLGRR
jgi:hypothetical protein